MPDLQPDVAKIAGLFVEAVLYGVHLVTLVQILMRAFVSSESNSASKPLSKVHLPTLVIALLLWANGTLNLSLGLLRAVQTYVYHVGGSGFNWIGIVKMFTVSVQIMLADAMLVYRCWRVYKQWKIVLFPVILWVLGAGASIWTLYVNVKSSTKQLYDGIQYPLSCVFWAFTMGLNLYTTTSIVYRIWRVERDVYKHSVSLDISYPNTPPCTGSLQSRWPSTRLQRVTKIIAMSGLVHTLVSITVFASEVARSNAIYITSAADIMAIGIAYNIMIIAVDKERTRGDRTSVVPPRLATIQFRSVTNHSHYHEESQSQSEYPSWQCVSNIARPGLPQDLIVRNDHLRVDVDLEHGGVDHEKKSLTEGSTSSISS